MELGGWNQPTGLLWGWCGGWGGGRRAQLRTSSQGMAVLLSHVGGHGPFRGVGKG